MPWTTISTNSELTAIHAALLPTEPDGVVFYYGDWSGGGDEDDVGVQDLTYSRLFRMAPGLDDPIVNFADGDLPETDCFCGGQAFLADGRLLSAGGTFGWAQQHGDFPNHYNGERACWIYLPRAAEWVLAADLNFQPSGGAIGGGRWYPTLVTLGNGEVFAVGGHPMVDDFYPPDVEQEFIRHNNNTPERYAPGANTWTLLTVDITAPNSTGTDSYPRFHLLPSGRLFSDTAGNGGTRRLFDPYAGTWTGPDIGGLGLLPSYYSRGSRGTSVLLPLLPPFYRPRVLVTNAPRTGEDDEPEGSAFRIDIGDDPTWMPTPDRQGSAAGRDRENACATLLPTGQVLVTGGWPLASEAIDPTTATTVPELYTPGIDWAAGDFSNSGDEDWQTIDEPSPNRRGYHSVALLLPDGRVWHGGSTTDGDGANRNIEVFAPAYVAEAGRPTISSCPDNIGYLHPFAVETPQAGQIARIALMRCGSITHGFNSDQRYVGLSFTHVGGDTLQVIAPPEGNVAPPGYYMLFLIDDQGRVCQRAAFIRVSRQKLVISADISTYSIFEVDALGPPSQFDDALFVVFDGFMPHEVVPIDATLTLPGGDPVPDVEISFGAAAYEAGSSQADVAQRVVFPVRLRFTSLDAFDEIPDDQDFINISFAARAGNYSASTVLQLSKNPNPRMRDGDPPWLSVDLRVFRINQGDSFVAGLAHPGAGGAYDYIQDVLAAFNDAAGEADHPFDALPVDQEVSRLELGTNDVNGDPVFNYAVARVRFVAPEGVDAADVRVFFRMWNTGWSALEFDLNGSYRRSGNGPDATPLLGLQGGEIGNIPCFAQARAANMAEQVDPTNRRTLQGAGTGEVHGYFGCWLDVNQDEPRFPLEPQSNGPFDDGDDPEGLRSIQQLMRGLHQCLVAEIHYTLDPVPNGATPGSSDNLAQRNILFDFSDNPGSFAAHLVHHTFELEPSPISFAQSVLAPARGPSSTAARLHPDELIIDWGGLPRDSLVTLYMPQVDAREIVRASAARQAPANLVAVGTDTIRCKVSDVGFIPIPGPLDRTIAGLLTVQLPPGVPYGKVYRVVLRQVSGRGYRVLGTTEFRIEVSRADQLLPRFRHNLAVLKHIAASIPVSNRWYPVFQRYLAELGDRFRAFGGDPDSVAPNPRGTGGRPAGDNEPEEGKTLCIRGEVAELHYGCCGEFEGFTLASCDGDWEFRCMQACFEPVLLTAIRNKMKATVHVRQGRAVDRAINRSCPWSGHPVRADALTQYRGRTVGFCSPHHRDRFAAVIALCEGRGGRTPTAPRPLPTPAPTAPRPNPQQPGPNTPPHGNHDAPAAGPLPRSPAQPGQPRRAQAAAFGAAAVVSPPASTPRQDSPPSTGAINERCPWSGQPVRAEALATFAGATVGFCSARHRDDFEAAVKAFDARISCPDECDRSRSIVERMDLHP